MGDQQTHQHLLRHARVSVARAAAGAGLHQGGRLVDAGRAAVRDAHRPAALLLGGRQRDVPQDPCRIRCASATRCRPNARHLLTLLLNRDPAQRLGSGPHGAADIKAHPFFAKHIDWKLLLAKKIPPPFKPSVASAIDTSNFDPEFTNEPPMDSVVDDSHMLSATVQEQFVGFSYNAPQRARRR
ncbi:hypothetical protein L1887_54515 [Cichorium endivia]|nr:hypothetical protein L1887_54515 [Cichorium endivia]